MITHIPQPPDLVLSRWHTKWAGNACAHRAPDSKHTTESSPIDPDPEEPADMDCADEHQNGSCSSQETWLSACEAQCPSNSTRRSDTSAGTRLSSGASDVGSDGSARSSLQRWAPTTDAVAVARERLAAALKQGGSMPQQRHTYAYGTAAQGTATLPVPAEQQRRHFYQQHRQQQQPRQDQKQQQQQQQQQPHGCLVTAAVARAQQQAAPPAAGTGTLGLQHLGASSPQRHRSPRRSRDLAVATARVSRNLRGAFDLAEIRAARQARRSRSISPGGAKAHASVLAAGGAAKIAGNTAATEGGGMMEDLPCVVQRTNSSGSDCSHASMDSGASDSTCFGAAAAVTTAATAQPRTLAAVTAAGRCFVAAQAVRTLAASVAGSLAALHGEAVVHCNVAADTIVLDSRDWFTARLQCDGWAARMGPAGGCMRPKLQIGSGTCCAPEVAGCKRGLAAYTPAGDMWGLGMVLLGLVCGGPVALCMDCPPGGGAASLDALQQHISAQLTDRLHKAHAERYSCGEALLSADVAEVLRALLHADPAQRPTARQLLHHQWLRKPAHARHGRL